MPTPALEVIGRDAERETIEALLIGPRPLTLVIDGEAGIGKTTLWSFAQGVATAHGERVLAWRASNAERDLAYAALMGLLDVDLGAAQDGLPPARRRALDQALGRADAPGNPPEPGLVGLALLDLLRALARSAPLVIAVDDLQWCDPASAGAIAFAARHVGTVLVGGEDTCLSLFEAEDAETVEEANERAGFHFDRVVRVIPIVTTADEGRDT